MEDKREKKTHIRTRIMWYFGVVLIFMSVCLLIFYYFYMHNIKRVTAEGMENVLTKINLETSTALSQMQEAAYLFARDSDIQEALRTELPEEEAELYSQRLDFMARLRYTIGYVKNLEGIYVIGENGARFRSSFSSMLTDDFREKDWYQKVRETGEPLWTIQQKGSFMIRDVNKPTISIVVPVMDRASSGFLGTVTVDVRIEDLQQFSKTGMVFDGYLFILGEDAQVLYSDMTGGAGDEILPELSGYFRDAKHDETDEEDGKPGEVSIGRHSYLLSDMQLDVAGWKLVGIVPGERVYQDVYRLRTIILVIMAVAIVTALLLSISASSSIAKPILLIRKAMKEAEGGNLETRAEIVTNDEVGDLAETFNHMLGQIGALMQERHEQEEKLRIAEFKSLQAQINPHFLYNTLDSINWMARAGNTDEVSEMIDSLSSFFRISLSRGRTFITVGEELQHAYHYLLIQQKRYKKYLEYEIDVPDELKNYLCLKMILQPLVENALYHGIKEKAEKGLVRISAHAEGEDILFTVRDTGKGMTPEKLKELKYMMEHEIEYNKNAYGVINVQRRIQTYFGNAYGLTFESAQGEGTTVTVRIPMREAEEEHVENRDRGR